MPRYNKIYAGPFTQPTPQVVERLAAVSLLPGQIVYINASNKFALANATTTGKLYVVQDNYLAMKGVDDPITADNTAIGMELLDDQLFNVRVPTGVNVAMNAALGTDANGKLILATGAGKQVVGFADEAYNNTSGADQLVRIRAAATHRLTA